MSYRENKQPPKSGKDWPRIELIISILSGRLKPIRWSDWPDFPKCLLDLRYTLLAYCKSSLSILNESILIIFREVKNIVQVVAAKCKNWKIVRVRISPFWKIQRNILKCVRHWWSFLKLLIKNMYCCMWDIHWTSSLELLLNKDIKV